MEPIPDVRRRRPEVPVAVAGLVATLMAKRPEQRSQSLAELVAALDNVLCGRPAAGSGPTYAPDQTRADVTVNPFTNLDEPGTLAASAPTLPARGRRRLVIAGVGAGVLLLASWITDGTTFQNRNHAGGLPESVRKYG
jgi:hypothetical protein